MFLDSHCHLVDEQFDPDRNEIIKRALDSGLHYLLTVGTNLEEGMRSLELADFYENIFAAAALHPHDAERFTDDTIQRFQQLYEHPKMLAIGEIGLDFYYDNSPRQVQEHVFRQFLRVSLETGKPVIIHLRDPRTGPKMARERFLTILDEEDPAKKIRGILHCFSDSYDFGMECYDRGFLISFPGILTFSKAEELRDAASRLPYESLLVETDCPYLAPQPFRGKRNEPAYVHRTAEKLAELRGITLEDLDRILLFNFENLFQLRDGEETGQISYKIRNSLYLNLTNRCTANCIFCERTKSAMVSGYYLRLRREPAVEEVLEAVGDPLQYDEVVFCGYGEPTIRLKEMKQIATVLKQKGTRIRLNTDGHAELIHGRDILPELKGLVDELSVSINAANASDYVRLMRPYQGKRSFEAMKNFIRRGVELGFEVSATAVAVPGLDLKPIEELALSLGAKWRQRMYNVVG